MRVMEKKNTEKGLSGGLGRGEHTADEAQQHYVI